MNHQASAPHVLDILRSHTLIAPDEACQLYEMHQRSLCYRVERADGRALFVKQAQPHADGGWSADVVGEARTLRQLAAVPALRPLVPAVLAVEQHPPTIVLEHLSGHVTVDVARRHPELDSRLLMAEVGRAAAAIHHVSPGADLDLPVLNHPASLVRLWSCVTPRQVTQHPDAYRELATRLQAGGLLDPLAELASSWSPARLVHGDLKADNVLCRPGGGAVEVRIVDWEVAGWGDPCWDLGSLIGDQLFDWLRGLVIEPGGQLSSWLANGARTPGDVRLAVSTLIDSYRAASYDGLDAGRLARSAQHAGVFLVHRLTSAAMSSARLTAQLLLALQLAGRLLRTPERALEALL